MPEKIMYLQAYLRATRIEVRINGIPVLRTADDGMRTVGKPIREFVLEGDNRVDVVLEPPKPGTTRPDEPHLPGPDVRALVRIAEFEDGEFLEFDGGRESATIDIVGYTPGLRGPIAQTRRFSASPRRKWAWAEARAVSWARSRPQLDDFFARVSRTFADRDADGLIACMAPRIRDDADAYPAIGYDDRIAAYRQNFAGMPDVWRPIPFDPKRAIYLPAADDRLVEALDRDGLPLVRTETSTPDDPDADPDYAKFPMMVGLHHGDLAVLR